MKVLILLFQVLSIAINVCKSENDSNGTVQVHLDDVRLGMTVQEINKTDGNDRNDFLIDSTDGEYDGNDLDFDYDEDEKVFGFKDDGAGEKQMQEALLKAMKEPAIRKQIGEVLPILRAMSSQQRLTLAALVSSRIMSQNPPSELNLSEVSSMFAGKILKNDDDRNNVTEYLLLPISMDVANMFRGIGREVGRNLRQSYYQTRKRKRNEGVQEKRQTRKSAPRSPQATAKRRIDVSDYLEFGEKIDSSEGKPKADSVAGQPGIEDCDFFTKSLCLEVSNYPTEAIISSLKNNADIAKTFLTDFDSQSKTQEYKSTKVKTRIRSRQLGSRQDNGDLIENADSEHNNYMCPSAVKYARPKRARATSGQWKYIVNAADYTQTLRIEICMKPKSSCSYVTNHLNSECSQVFNYHRLLSWDESRGLHMDVFKVPSCCSCRIQGYTNFFPPNGDFTFAEKRKEPAISSEFPPKVQQQNSEPSNVANKIEVPKVIPREYISSASIRPQLFYNPNLPGFPGNPAEHLMPPGPPLPLEHEARPSQAQESKHYNKKGPSEYNSRYPVPTESSRMPIRGTERILIQNQAGGATAPSKNRLNIQQRPQIRRPLTNQQNNFQKNGGFEQGSQIRYVVNPSQLRPTNDIKKIKSNEGGLYNKLNSGSQFQNRFRTNARQPSQHHNWDYGDQKAAPSRTSYIYARPNKFGAKGSTTTTTTAATTTKTTTANRAPQIFATSIPSDQKKINYNYHPIIDFFRTNSNKKRQTSGFSAPKEVDTSQDWTPMLGQQ